MTETPYDREAALRRTAWRDVPNASSYTRLQWWECSFCRCHFAIVLGPLPFCCPNCGAWFHTAPGNHTP